MLLLYIQGKRAERGDLALGGRGVCVMFYMHTLVPSRRIHFSIYGAAAACRF